jgi:hypothetical protein
MKEMLSITTKQCSHEIVGNVVENNFEAQAGHSCLKGK